MKAVFFKILSGVPINLSFLTILLLWSVSRTTPFAAIRNSGCIGRKYKYGMILVHQTSIFQCYHQQVRMKNNLYWFIHLTFPIFLNIFIPLSHFLCISEHNEQPSQPFVLYHTYIWRPVLSWGTSPSFITNSKCCFCISFLPFCIWPMVHKRKWPSIKIKNQRWLRIQGSWQYGRMKICKVLTTLSVMFWRATNPVLTTVTGPQHIASTCMYLRAYLRDRILKLSSLLA